MPKPVGASHRTALTWSSFLLLLNFTFCFGGKGCSQLLTTEELRLVVGTYQERGEEDVEVKDPLTA
jgi:hypothetical protein